MAAKVNQAQKYPTEAANGRAKKLMQKDKPRLRLNRTPLSGV